MDAGRLVVIACGAVAIVVVSGCSCGRAPGPSGGAVRDAAPDVGAGASIDGGPSLGRFELCNNGIDDDQNGAIDDGCGCSIGQEQPCYPGWPAYAGVGTCELGEQRCVADGAIGRWGACEGAAMPGTETCGDGLDEDCDGAIDERCECESEATQPCFVGAAARADVGRCASGTQTCDGVFAGPDGEGILGWGACEGATAPRAELCNGLDDDCDGAIDERVEICNLADDDCDGAIDESEACGALPANYFLTRYWAPTGSGILPAEAQLFATVATAPGAGCPEGEILIEAAPGDVRCVPSPPTDCPPGTRYEWIADGWECRPCDLLVQFGHLFAFERTCAPEPRLTCEEGLVPTYRVETRTWECIEECDNGEYDRAYRDGRLVCIPC